MRTFKTESMWDKENGEWIEVYFINDQEVDQDKYFEELENEEYFEDEEITEENTCDCDECCEQCEENQDDDNNNLCFCNECQKEREQNLLDDLFSMMFDENACRNCVISKIIDTVYKFKELGYLESRAEIKAFLDD